MLLPLTDLKIKKRRLNEEYNTLIRIILSIFILFLIRQWKSFAMCLVFLFVLLEKTPSRIAIEQQGNGVITSSVDNILDCGMPPTFKESRAVTNNYYNS